DRQLQSCDGGGLVAVGQRYQFAVKTVAGGCLQALECLLLAVLGPDLQTEQQSAAGPQAQPVVALGKGSGSEPTCHQRNGRSSGQVAQRSAGTGSRTCLHGGIEQGGTPDVPGLRLDPH